MKPNTHLTAVAGLLVTLFSSIGIAGELPAGTVISKENIDKVKADTFEGHSVAALLTDKIEMQIRNWGLKMKLTNSRPLALDPSVDVATKKYSDRVKFDTATREVTGYVAGLPFPDISDKDPNAGDKVMWNFYYAAPQGNQINYRVAWVLIDGNKGVDQVQDYAFVRLWKKNRLDGGEPVLGDGSVLTETLYAAVAPEDIKGTGTFTVRYDQSRFEDQWAYIKSARRIRRLSGSAWMDPVGGLGMLNDEIYVWNARPSLYKQTKLIGKRWILVSTNTNPKVDASKKGTPAEWTSINTGVAPYWNPLLEYQPREVYVIEGTPPAEHPYSKKIVYVDTKVPVVYMGEMYDKKGEIWRHVQFDFRQQKGEDGVTYYPPVQGTHIDFKEKRASVFVARSLKIGEKNFDMKGFGPEMLERIR
ncbi:MAG: DUF1329 domain-containing protein [Undibacterium sp.]|nr:DUF1329 domain-containing protein [Undibacterium sp.]